MRSRKGSAIAETGPALFMFMIIIFFPLLDVMGMAAQYACCWYHNHMMMEELSVRKNDQAGAVHAEVEARFDHSGLSKFANVDSINDTTSYVDAAAGNPATVTCTSTLNGRPYIALPFLGFTKTTFSISNTATREVTERKLI
jgi:hypothetical protein